MSGIGSIDPTPGQVDMANTKVTQWYFCGLFIYFALFCFCLFGWLVFDLVGLLPVCLDFCFCGMFCFLQVFCLFACLLFLTYFERQKKSKKEGKAKGLGRLRGTGKRCERGNTQSKILYEKI